MEFIDIKTTKVIFSDDDKFALERAIEIVNELLDHMDEVDAEMALRDPYTVEDNESISMTEIEETIRNLEFIKDICEIV